ncbi:hypothetical protein MMC18_007148 [Xylographa bjoerkii]|nr:hypothetical protein [Xylographa bjoerkii]
MAVENMPTSFQGVNHIKLPATDILKTYNFYTSIFPLTKIPEYEHYNAKGELFAVMFRHEPTKLIVEVRKHNKQAQAQVGWDPITWGVGRREDLEEWASWFDKHNVKHSTIFTGVKGWVMGAEDPDGKIIRLYTEEEHRWSSHPDEDDYWLGSAGE